MTANPTDDADISDHNPAADEERAAMMILIAGPYRSGTRRRTRPAAHATSTGSNERPGRCSLPDTCR